MKRTHLLTGAGAAACLVLACLASAGPVQAAQTARTTGHHRQISRAAVAASRTAYRKATAQLIANDARRLRLGTGEGLVVKDVVVDPDGMRHVRYDRTYRGLPVIGGDLVIHKNPDGSTQGVSWASRDRIVVPTVVASRRTIPHGRAATAREVVFAARHTPVLAWETHLKGRDSDGTPIDRLVYTDARTGKRLGVRENVFTDSGTGNSLYSGTVTVGTTPGGLGWNLVDGTRGGHSTYDANNVESTDPGTLFSDADNTWGDGTTADRASAAVDAQYGAAMTWDFYKNVLGRTGIRGDGVAAYSNVHFGTNYENAFWDNSCFCMSYGDGNNTFRPLVALDVAGHEMTHGVTAATDGLDYSGDAGGLNESSSDVMGTMVEFYANNPADPGDYYIGEKITKVAPFYLRRMDKPSLDGHSVNCYSSTVKRLDPHYSSGVGNHAFYLLAEGTGSKTIGGLPHRSTTCNSTTFGGVGRAKAAAIWYRAMKIYWTSTTTYPQAANGMVRAARDLYGRSSSTCNHTVWAWKGVSVTPTSSCNTRAEVPGTANAVTNPGFESGVTKWSQSQAGIITQAIPSGPQPRTGQWFAWLGGYAGSHTDRITHSRIVVPVTKSARLSFYLFGYTENTSNTAGDRVTIQIRSGTTTSTIKTYYDTSASFNYDLKKFDITRYSGKTITLYITVVDNNDGLTSGWLVDDVSVTATH